MNEYLLTGTLSKYLLKVKNIELPINNSTLIKKATALTFNAICILLGLLGLVTLIISSSSEYQRIMESLSSIGAFMSGLSGFSLAIIALLSLNTWKKQIIYNKNIELIWKAKSALKDLENKLYQYQAISVLRDPTNIKWRPQSELIPIQKEVQKSHDYFCNFCSQIDANIAENDAKYQNLALIIISYTPNQIHIKSSIDVNRSISNIPIMNEQLKELELSIEP
ncbi:hypothetical protein [Paraferrimonas sp. SM1919]|uniref:hypothetical protein n=1 Tax=Paraferrimonas sp. SM1919 TaxID=2662263 RepID=UPI0013D42E13|nr:hypothetical protein [Paraferrimonas sp. SM1919]